MDFTDVSRALMWLASLLLLLQQRPPSFMLSGAEAADAGSQAGGQTTAKENAWNPVQYGHQYLLPPGLHLICLTRYHYGNWNRLLARDGRRAVQWVNTSLAGG